VLLALRAAAARGGSHKSLRPSAATGLRVPQHRRHFELKCSVKTRQISSRPYDVTDEPSSNCKRSTFSVHLPLSQHPPLSHEMVFMRIVHCSGRRRWRVCTSRAEPTSCGCSESIPSATNIAASTRRWFIHQPSYLMSTAYLRAQMSFPYDGAPRRHHSLLLHAVVL
jgi:hypothetical protein